MLGSLGSVIFEVSDSQVLAFRDLSFSRGASYAEHKIIGGSTLLEFTGLSSATASVKIIFDDTLGTSPADNLKAIEDMMNKHEAVLFVLEGKPIGSGYWVIESINETVETVESSGHIRRASVNLSLKEYL